MTLEKCGGPPKKTKTKILSSFRESLEVIMRNIQKEKKKDFFRGSPAAILTSAGATSLEETARLSFFLLRHVWLEHASRREKSVTNGL